MMMKKTLQISILFFLFIIISAIVSAQIESDKITAYIIEDKVYFEKQIVFSEQFTGDFALNIPDDANGISLYVDDARIEFISNTITLVQNQKIKLSYTTKALLDGQNFIFDFNSNYKINQLSIKLILPEDRGLLKPFLDGKDGSAYPKPDQITTDGRSIILIWNRNTLEQNSTLGLFVVLEKKTSVLPTIFIIIGILVVLGVIMSLIFIKQFKKLKSNILMKSKEIKHKAVLQISKSKPKKHQKPKKIIQKQLKSSTKTQSKTINESENQAQKTEETAELMIPEKDQEKVAELLSHLKEEEQQIVQVLAQREGQCEQGTLRIVTNYPKSTLSRILSELEERNIIYKEKRGKKNLVFLKKQF